jgi:hypothetical protein
MCNVGWHFVFFRFTILHTRTVSFSFTVAFRSGVAFGRDLSHYIASPTGL